MLYIPILCIRMYGDMLAYTFSFSGKKGLPNHTPYSLYVNIIKYIRYAVYVYVYV